MPCRLATPQWGAHPKDSPGWCQRVVCRIVSSLKKQAALLWIGVLGACAQAVESPEDVLESFLQEVSFGRLDKAAERLSRSTRDALSRRYHEMRERTGLPPKEPEPADLLSEGLDLTVLNSAESIVVVSPLGDSVTLRATVEGGASAEVFMVREDGAWRIDLLRSLGSS